MRIASQLVEPQYYGENRNVEDIKYIVIQTIGNKAVPHYYIQDGIAIQKVPDEYTSDAVSGGRVNKYGYLHGVCTKYNSISIGLPEEISLENKTICVNLIMTIKQRYNIANNDIVRQMDVTGACDPECWFNDTYWNKDIKDRLIEI